MRRTEALDIICFNCKHLDTIRIGGCKAFPGEIPDIILNGQSDHQHRIRGQEGDYVYTPIEEPMKIWRRFDKPIRPNRKVEKKVRA